MEMMAESRFFLAGINGNTGITGVASPTLRDAFLEEGLLAETLEEATCLIIVDADSQTELLVKIAAAKGIVSILVRNEPNVVCPKNYDARLVKRFDYVVDVGRRHAMSHYSSNWPQSWPDDSQLERYSEVAKRKRAVLVNANKLSLIPGELYSLRRSIVDSGLVDYYGIGWESSNVRRLRILLGELRIALGAGVGLSMNSLLGWFKKHHNSGGAIEDKLETMSRYEFAIVIENSSDYMSEKLFDALFAGCIPIYVGLNPMEQGLPKDLVIVAEPSKDSIQEALLLAHQLDYNDWKAVRNDFLRSPITRRSWESKTVFRSIASFAKSASSEPRVEGIV